MTGPAMPDAWWTFEATATDRSLATFVRLARVGARCWYWCYLVGDDTGLVVVRDHDVAPPRRAEALEVRADALWAELVCETPDEHWGISLEAFGVRLDAPSDAWPVDPRAGEIGERVAVGLDLEWEADRAGPPTGGVHGEVLLGRERLELDGVGVLDHAVAPATAWPATWTGRCRGPDERWVQVVDGDGARADPPGIGEPRRFVLADGSTAAAAPRAVVPVPLTSGPDPSGGRGPALVRAWTDVVTNDGAADVTRLGWVEVLQS